ncbi:Enamine deaminase RidA [Maribacter dokdonensis]|nr:Enamine deaminase RidA [Maribacter dokdonensis]
MRRPACRQAETKSFLTSPLRIAQAMCFILKNETDNKTGKPKTDQCRHYTIRIMKIPTNRLALMATLFAMAFVFQSCEQKQKEETSEVEEEVIVEPEKPEYFLLRPEVEKAYGYSHAVKIGNSIKISGAVSMDDEGNPTAIGDMEQQMKNCYADLEKILKHFGCTFDDVVKEDVFTTDMAQMLEKSAYRAEIYKNGFPTGSWLEVKGLALPEFMVEIELEVHKSE